MVDQSESVKMVEDMSDKKSTKKLKSKTGTGFISEFVAKKDHRLFHSSDSDYTFKKGNNYSDIPDKWKTTLETEGII